MVIPDDRYEQSFLLNYFFLKIIRSSRSQFAVIGDDLLVQLRHILEEDPKDEESRVFTMARNVYKVRC